MIAATGARITAVPGRLTGAGGGGEGAGEARGREPLACDRRAPQAVGKYPGGPPGQGGSPPGGEGHPDGDEAARGQPREQPAAQPRPGRGRRPAVMSGGAG